MSCTTEYVKLTSNDLLTVTDLSRDEVLLLLETAEHLKKNRDAITHLLANRVLAMVFEKPSLRTRVSFEIGFAKLGGTAIYLDQQGVRMGERESVSDCAKNLERWVDVLVARTFSHETIAELADAARIPVVNALSDLFHPCQALADMFTLTEILDQQQWSDRSLVYIGDGNNVCHSLMLITAMLGMRMTVVTPTGYEPAKNVVMQAVSLAKVSGGVIEISNDVHAVQNHDVVYGDTWVSMGDESENDERKKAFEGYQITKSVMNLAGKNSYFMHCLPAKRGIEVTEDVMDSTQSIVFDQAENRMHAQNALLVHLLANNGTEKF